MGRNFRRALVPGLVVLALVAIVAVAATGSVPGSTSDTRRPPNVLFDTVFSLLAVALIPAAVLLVYGLAQRREVSAEYSRIRRRNHVLVLLLLLLPVLVWLHGLPKPARRRGARDSARTSRDAGDAVRNEGWDAIRASVRVAAGRGDPLVARRRGARVVPLLAAQDAA